MSEVKTNKISPSVGTTLTLGDSGDTITTAGTATGFGITHASQWRLNTNFTGDASPIDANLEEVDAPVGFGVLGSSMTEASGIFTFPSTGYWLITFDASFSCIGNNRQILVWIYTTHDDSTWAKAAEGNCFTNSATMSTPIYASATASYIFDVTSTSTHKCAFYVDMFISSDTTEGNTDRNKTWMTFVKLADT